MRSTSLEAYKSIKEGTTTQREASARRVNCAQRKGHKQGNKPIPSMGDQQSNRPDE